MIWHRRVSILSVLILSLALAAAAQTAPVDLQIDVPEHLRFIAYGDTRFTDPANTEAANPMVRKLLVQAIADEHPAFISIGGDIAFNGNKADDWATYDNETAVWKSLNIHVYPALGNHDLHGDPKVSLANYFQRYPELHQSRFYSLRAGPILLLTLDSSLEELSGPQGEWIKAKLDALPKAVKFVVIVMHHPPYTSSSDAKKFGGGHSERATEQAFATFLEAKQPTLAARIIVIAGHVHNYERHEHGGITYFVTGGGGAHAYPIERAPNDPFQSTEINYHYLRFDIDNLKATVTMRRLEITDGKPRWTDADHVGILNTTP